MTRTSTKKTDKPVNKPVHKCRVGHVSSAVWQGETKDGVVTYSVTLQKSYQNDDGVWLNTDFLWASDVLPAMKALDKAHDYILSAYENKTE